MRSLPIATDAITFLAVAVTRAERRQDPENRNSPMVPKADELGQPLWRCQVLAKIEDPEVVDPDELRGELLEVEVAGGRPKVAALDEVVFEGLAARAWNMDTRSGVSFKARSVAKAGSKPARQPVPAVPGSTDGGS